MTSLLPIDIFHEAIQAVPALKYALGVAGLVALIAIIRTFKLDLKVAAFGTIVMFAFMVVLVVFAKLTTTAPSHFLWPVLVMMWAFLVLVIASATLLFSAVFFDRPKAFHDWLFPTKLPIVSVIPAGAVSELLAAAKMQSGAGDYEGAWKQIEEALKLDPNFQNALKVQTQLAMDWLRNIRIVHHTGKATFSAIVDLVSPSLYRSAASGKGEWAGDIHAHIGWGLFLKYREGVGGLDIEKQFRQALELDGRNVFAHTMWGFWILWQGGDLEEANRHFTSALESGRERTFVKDLHLAALHNGHHSLELLRFADQLRLNHEALDLEQRDRIVGAVYFGGSGDDIIDNLNTQNPVLPASQHLATLAWLCENSARYERELRFFTARLTEATGELAKALVLYRSLKASDYSFSGSLEKEINRGIARCDPEEVKADPQLLNRLKQLKGTGREATNAVPELVEALKVQNDEIREAALDVLQEIGSNARVAVPALMELAKTGPAIRIRERAAYTLGEIGPEATAAVPILLKMLKDRDGEPGYRGALAAEALGKIGPAAKEAVPVLAEALEAYDEIRLPGHAAEALGRMGAEAKMAVPALIQAMKDQDKEHKINRAEPLGLIAAALRDQGDVESIPLLQDILRSFEGENFEPKVIGPVREALDFLKERKQVFPKP